MHTDKKVLIALLFNLFLCHKKNYIWEKPLDYLHQGVIARA